VVVVVAAVVAGGHGVPQGDVASAVPPAQLRAGRAQQSAHHHGDGNAVTSKAPPYAWHVSVNVWHRDMRETARGMGCCRYKVGIIHMILDDFKKLDTCQRVYVSYRDHCVWFY
jgi:hypothetical protein